MFVIRLPNGNLMVPQTATGNDGRILGDVYVEIGPQDADYARLAWLVSSLATVGGALGAVVADDHRPGGSRGFVHEPWL